MAKYPKMLKVTGRPLIYNSFQYWVHNHGMTLTGGLPVVNFGNFHSINVQKPKWAYNVNKHLPKFI